MKYRILLLLAFIAAAAIGCDSVSIDAPVGERLSSESNSPFAGRWSNEDSEIIEVQQRQDGSLVAGWMNWDQQKQEFEIHSFPIDSRRVGSNVYFFIQGEAGKDFGLMRVESVGEDQLKTFGVNPDKFRSAVEAGKLAGKIEVNENDHFNVRLNADSAAIAEVLGEADVSEWFPTKKPTTFRRIKRFDEHKSAKPADEPASR